MIYTMLKVTYTKLQPKKFQYRFYKSFNNENFIRDLKDRLEIVRPYVYASFQNAFETVLDKHAPLKTKIIRGNNKPHMSKQLGKEIMKRSRLKNLANQTKNPEDIRAYKKQRNLVVTLNKQQKKIYFSSIHTDGNKTSFW